MVTFLLDLGQKVFSWVTVKIIVHFLSNIIKYTITWHFNYKNSNYHQEILQKILKKYFLRINQGLKPEPLDCETCMLQKSYQDFDCREGFFMVLKKVPCFQKIFALLTSLSSELEKKQPKFPCGNLIFSKDGQKWPSKTIFPTLLYLKHCFATST